MDIRNLSKQQYTYDLLKQGLNASNERSSAIADNLSNINTKGYKRKYVTFEENLKNSMGELDLKTTDEKHISTNSSVGQVEVKEDNSGDMREDGNNVDLDNEMVNMASNQLMYNAMISQVNSRLSMERYVITGGGR